MPLFIIAIGSAGKHIIWRATQFSLVDWDQLGAGGHLSYQFGQDKD
jgi:hypothetical protein